MESQVNKIFNELVDFGPCTAQGLAQHIDAPEASVRRAIGQIRSEGFKIDLIRSKWSGNLYRFKA